MPRNSNSLNEALKQREQKERQRLLKEVDGGQEKAMALDDIQRVKVLSPGRLVSKRFFRNKLALVGLGILIFMFSFAFLFPLFYPYTQTQIFYKYDELMIRYAGATERNEVTTYAVDPDAVVHYSVLNRMNSYITDMEASGKTQLFVSDTNGIGYVVDKLGDKVYALSANETKQVASYQDKAVVATYSSLGKSFSWNGQALSEAFQTAAQEAVEGSKTSFTVEGNSYTVTPGQRKNFVITRETAGFSYEGKSLGEAFEAAASDAIAKGEGSFSLEGKTYIFQKGNGSTAVLEQGESTVAQVSSSFVFNLVDNKISLSNTAKADALLALYKDGTFTIDGQPYTIEVEEGSPVIRNQQGEEYALLSNYSVRRASGEDSCALGFKDAVVDTILKMEAQGSRNAEFSYELPAMDEEANYIYDENGELTYAQRQLFIEKTPTMYVITCSQVTYLIDLYAKPSSEHWFGTDADGMDILARAMYGGRISLMVGFVVVFLEMLLGIILGGLAGFFSGWVDTLVMRLVDIFYCIPSMPILIITGALFDAMKMNAYVRLMWLMAILGFLGWAGVARMVRGQILSLREQEFMVAEEATGMRASRRIFRHLVPNVMPQLIVSATMGLGSVIITESTLSFLGLGVKHPLATWGNMINACTGSSEDMIRYAYIWVPIGLLICLTVIAFNFVGDGLRDAFDPKMKQ